jgi:hypothetical protein
LKLKLCSFMVNEPVSIPVLLGINKELIVSCLVFLVIQCTLIGLLLGAKLVLDT